MKLLSVLSTALDSLGRLIPKAGNGKSDTRTAKLYGPYGFESNPIKGVVILYSRTEVDGKEAFVACLNKNCVTESGESRIFSTDTNGTLKYNIWLKADGTVLMGTSNNPDAYTNFAVKFNELKTEFNALKQTVNDLITKYNSHTQIVNVVTTCPAGAGTGTGTASAPSVTQNPNTSNIDNAKNEKIKTN
jgi:hypothetical protein